MNHRELMKKSRADLAAMVVDLTDGHARLVDTVSIHHKNFDELYERASRESGEFAAWVASMTHPQAEMR